MRKFASLRFYIIHLLCAFFYFICLQNGVVCFDSCQGLGVIDVPCSSVFCFHVVIWILVFLIGGCVYWHLFVPVFFSLVATFHFFCIKFIRPNVILFLSLQILDARDNGLGWEVCRIRTFQSSNRRKKKQICIWKHGESVHHVIGNEMVHFRIYINILLWEN